MLNDIFIVRYTDATGIDHVSVQVTTTNSNISRSGGAFSFTNSFEIYETDNRYVDINIEQHDDRFTAALSGESNQLTLQTQLGPRSIRTKVNSYTSQLQLVDSAARESIQDVSNGQIFMANLGIPKTETAKLSSYMTGFGNFITYVYENSVNAYENMVDAFEGLMEDVNDKIRVVQTFVEDKTQQLADTVDRYVVEPMVKVADRVKAGMANFAIVSNDELSEITLGHKEFYINNFRFYKYSGFPDNIVGIARKRNDGDIIYCTKKFASNRLLQHLRQDEAIDEVTSILMGIHEEIDDKLSNR